MSSRRNESDSSSRKLLHKAIETWLEEQRLRLEELEGAKQARQRHHVELSTALRDVEEQARRKNDTKLVKSLKREERLRKKEEGRVEEELHEIAREWQKTHDAMTAAVQHLAEEMIHEQEKWNDTVRSLHIEEQANAQQRQLIEALRRAKEAVVAKNNLVQALFSAEETSRERFGILSEVLRKAESMSWGQKAKRRQEEGKRRRTSEQSVKSEHDSKQKAKEEDRKKKEERARESENRRHAEARQHAAEAVRAAYDKAKQYEAGKKAQAEEWRIAVVNAWEDYEERWKTLQFTKSLNFRSIPWPVVSKVTLPEFLLPNLIAEFILSPYHSEGKSRRHRIHAALLRWHTDRFDAKFMEKIDESERDAVQEGVGRVVRCLSEMLAESEAM